MFKNLIAIFKIISGQRALIAKSIFAIFAISFCLLSIGREIKTLIDFGINLNDLSALNLSAIKILLLLCAFSLLSIVRSTSVSKLSNKIIHDLRCKAYANLLSRKVVYFEKHSAAKLQLGIVECAQSVSVIIQEVFSFLLRNIIIFISSIFLMYWQSRLLLGLVLLVVFAAFLPVIFFVKRAKNLNQNKQLLNKSMSELIVEVVENIKLIYGYNLQDSSVEKFNAISSKLTAATDLANINRSIFLSSIIYLNEMNLYR